VLLTLSSLGIHTFACGGDDRAPETSQVSPNGAANDASVPSIASADPAGTDSEDERGPAIDDGSAADGHDVRSPEQVPTEIATPASLPAGGVQEIVQAVVNGPLSFAAPLDISAGVQAGSSALDAQDLDGDGYVDVAVFMGSPRRFSWYQSPKTPGAGGWIKHNFPQPAVWRGFIGAAKFADIDRDGDFDLVVTMDDSTPSAYIYWLENPRPSASATSAWTIRQIRGDLPIRHINDLEIADMDGDGRLDVILRALEPSNELHIYFQDSATAWTGKVISAAPFGPTGEGFVVGNIDGAGQRDITICGHWLRAPSDPRKQSYTPFAIDAAFKEINQNTKEDVGDIDKDGLLDVVISPAEGYRSGKNHVLAWYRNPGNPASASSWTRTVLADNFNGGHTVELADMDRDGDLDVVSGVSWDLWGQTRSVKVYYNLDRGRFGNVQTVAKGKGLYSGVVRDIGKDSDLDIVGQDGYAGKSLPYLYEVR
jgi:hypothetical protein